MSDREKAVTAYHEAGHALVARKPQPSTRSALSRLFQRKAATPGFCLMRTGATGVEVNSWIIPACLLGGQAAEQLVFGETTTGSRPTTSSGRNQIARPDGPRPWHEPSIVRGHWQPAAGRFWRH